MIAALIVLAATPAVMSTPLSQSFCHQDESANMFPIYRSETANAKRIVMLPRVKKPSLVDIPPF